VKILVTGAEGMLGKAVVNHFASANAPFSEVVGIDLADGDLTQTDVVDSLFLAHQPDWVVHCAAWTDVDGAESHQEKAMLVNRDATGNLVQACQKNGCGLTYLSTDYVFNGQGTAEGYSEDESRDPVNYYGLTKAGGEEFVEQMTEPWQIVRISWLFGDGPINFPRTIRRLLTERDTLKVVDDQRGCPTYTEDLARVLAFLVSGAHRGIFHATNSGVCTWFDLAREVARALGADPERISPCPSSEYPTPTVRPSCSVLRSSALEKIGCPERPSWQDALNRYLQRLENDQA